MKHYIFRVFLAMLIWVACNPPQKFTYKESANLPAEGFDEAGSDLKAVQIADEVMRAMGGRAQWDAARYLRWTFFNRRALLWDKHKQRVRIDFYDSQRKIIFNLKDKTGRVWLNGAEQTQPDTLKKYIEQGYKVWINDSYWLVMPFKLKDSGVTLKYLGEKENSIEAKCNVLQLTFKNVGVTPDNKYWIWVSPSSHLVTEWAYFEKFSDETPKFRNAWADYRALGKIMLSVSRGERGTLMPMGVYSQVSKEAFESFAEIDWKKAK